MRRARLTVAARRLPMPASGASRAPEAPQVPELAQPASPRTDRRFRSLRGLPRKLDARITRHYQYASIRRLDIRSRQEPLGILGRLDRIRLHGRNRATSVHRRRILLVEGFLCADQITVVCLHPVGFEHMTVHYVAGCLHDGVQNQLPADWRVFDARYRRCRTLDDAGCFTRPQQRTGKLHTSRFRDLVRLFPTGDLHWVNWWFGTHRLKE